jgi:hypothetical protein
LLKILIFNFTQVIARPPPDWKIAVSNPRIIKIYYALLLCIFEKIRILYKYIFQKIYILHEIVSAHFASTLALRLLFCNVLKYFFVFIHKIKLNFLKCSRFCVYSKKLIIIFLSTHDAVAEGAVLPADLESI